MEGGGEINSERNLNTIMFIKIKNNRKLVLYYLLTNRMIEHNRCAKKSNKTSENFNKNCL